MVEDFSKVTLFPEELRMLKKLSKGGTVKREDVNGAALRSLGNQYGFVQLCEDELYRITINGKRFLAFRREDRFRHRWPVYLSTAAFVVSLGSIVLSLISLLSGQA